MYGTPQAFCVRPSRTDEISTVIEFRGAPGVGRMGHEALRAEFAAGRMCPEWTFVAEGPGGELLGRAVWWGFGGEPMMLAEWDVAPDVPGKAEIGAGLILSGVDLDYAREDDNGPLYTIRLPAGWTDDPACLGEVGWRCAAGEIVGWNEFNERDSFEWVSGRGPSDRSVPRGPSDSAPRRERLRFRPGTDEEFMALVAACAEGSLDVTTARGLAAGTEEAFGEFLSELRTELDGDRSWWRVAELPAPGGSGAAGEGAAGAAGATGATGAADAVGAVREPRPVGYVFPSVHDGSFHIAHLGVLPAFRGHGFVDELVRYARDVLAAEHGARRIRATTDSINAPYTRALRRAGFLPREVEIHLEAP